MHSALGGLQRQAQRRLLVEAVLIEDDAARADMKQEVAEGCEDSDGLGTQRASCPSRDRARASLRRLRPTAWRCTQPDAHAAAINESEGSEPLSQLLQAVATTGKRLPWAHLAAREEAAAVGMGVSTSGRGADGDQTAEAETRQGKQQQSAAQDWSWLASPPWGVVPLPPELACRVGPDGRLRPGTCSAEAIATHAESVASACPPHVHSDPHCAQLHTQLHRMTAAVQQVRAGGGGGRSHGYYGSDGCSRRWRVASCQHQHHHAGRAELPDGSSLGSLQAVLAGACWQDIQRRLRAGQSS